MDFIKPKTVEDANLSSSSIPEPDASVGEVAWNAGTAYAEGDLAIRTTTHRVYRRLVAGTTATAPENDATNWEDFAPTNRWAMFDESVGTVSLESGTAATLTVVLEPGIINSLALLELVGQSVTITAKDAPGGTVVYGPVTYSLELSSVSSWYEYFFEPFDQRETLVLTDIPPYSAVELTIEINGSGSAGVGLCVVGTKYTLGSTEYGVTAGIRSYSRKTTNEETGVVTIERRKSAKLMTARFLLDEAAVNVVHRRLTGVLDTLCVWLGDNGAGLDPLVVAGFYRDFTLDLQQSKRSYYRLEVEGLT